VYEYTDLLLWHYRRLSHKCHRVINCSNVTMDINELCNLKTDGHKKDIHCCRVLVYSISFRF